MNRRHTVNRRTLIFAVGLTLVASASWWLAERVNAPPTSADSAPTDAGPDYIIENLTSSAQDKTGRRAWQLSAARLEHDPHADGAHLVEPRLTQYPKTGAPVRTRANRGWLPDDQSHVLMQGDVRVTRGPDDRAVGGTMMAEQMRIELEQ